MLNRNQNPPNWYNMEAAFALRAAKDVSLLTAVKQTGQLLPASPSLEQNYPNPFNPSTVIKISLDENGPMSLKIYNELGELVKTVDQGYKPAGDYSYLVTMNDYTSGVYFDSLEEGHDFRITRKMLLLK